MYKYAGIIWNDLAAAPGVCLSFFTQGCARRCEGCHNPETWDFDGGMPCDETIFERVYNGLHANGVHRSLCILGGEPMHPSNLGLVRDLIIYVKQRDPSIKIYIWTGYLYETLKERNDADTKYILRVADVLIDGPFILSQLDKTLPMRGSRNQRIIDLHDEKLTK